MASLEDRSVRRCRECRWTAPSSFRLEFHIRAAHPSLSKYYYSERDPRLVLFDRRCRFCSMEFSDHAKRMVHSMKEHSAPYLCMYCGYLSANRLVGRELSVHNRSKFHCRPGRQHEGSWFGCMFCVGKIQPEPFFSKTIVNKHVRETHLWEYANLRCEACDTIMPCMEALKMHMSLAHPQPTAVDDTRVSSGAQNDVGPNVTNGEVVEPQPCTTMDNGPLLPEKRNIPASPSRKRSSVPAPTEIKLVNDNETRKSPRNPDYQTEKPKLVEADAASSPVTTTEPDMEERTEFFCKICKYSSPEQSAVLEHMLQYHSMPLDKVDKFLESKVVMVQRSVIKRRGKDYCSSGCQAELQCASCEKCDRRIAKNKRKLMDVQELVKNAADLVSQDEKVKHEVVLE